jgi:DNA-binding NarL/FixJ family response regulator
LSRGLNSTSVCLELSISRSTIKAHLRNIFAKTEVASMAELLYMLLAPARSEAEPSETALARRA